MAPQNKWEDEDLPILSKRLLFSLNPTLEINPILAGQYANGNFVFNFVTGEATIYDGSMQVEQAFDELRDQPATAPQVTELVIICDQSPWCTVVRDDDGVTVDGVLQALFEDYDQLMTVDEIVTLNPRMQEQLARTRRTNEQNAAMGMYPLPPGQFKRCDLLRSHIFFRHLDKDDNYIGKRLRYTAPNVFVMRLMS